MGAIRNFEMYVQYFIAASITRSAVEKSPGTGHI